jgi:hypothetical protein
LAQTSHQLAASMYQQASSEGHNNEYQAAGVHNPAADAPSNLDEEVVDAEYEEVN